MTRLEATKPDSVTWTFDVNRNGQWDGPSVDYLGYFGGTSNIPVFAKLLVSGTASV